MLSFPVVYTNYGDFQFGHHEREVFAAHRELVVATNEMDSITGKAEMAVLYIIVMASSKNVFLSPIV